MRGYEGKVSWENSCLTGMGDMVFLEEGVEPGTGQARYMTGLFDVSMGQRHELLEIILFYHGKLVFMERLETWEGFGLIDIRECRFIRRYRTAGMILGYVDTEIGGQVHRVNNRVLFGYHHDPFDGVEQLPDVARPVVLHQDVEAFR